jgi:gluconolactonase
MFDKDGKLVGCENGGRKLSRDVLSDHPESLADQYDGKKLNSPNDLWIDTDGGIYFTDPCYGPREGLEQDKEAVYYFIDDKIMKDKKITRVIGDLVRPNGLAISPSGERLYVIDNGSDTLYRYKIEAPGKLGPGELIAHIPEPDGMAVDKDGRLYVTSVGGVAVLAPNGKWLGEIPVPEQPANCKFGDKDLSTLYMTARTSLYSIPTETRGWCVHVDGVSKSSK